VLLHAALGFAKLQHRDFLVGDARIPSYNGSEQYPAHEHFKKDQGLHDAIDIALKNGTLPSADALKRDPVAGFYLQVFLNACLLGITDENFWKGDEPCGGHMAIGYVPVRRK
jgi:hypothetical protein